MDEGRMARAVSFGAWADEYDACRPSYPDTAVRWLLGGARRVVEAGAGTGKLTDRLVERDGLTLDVTEIDGRMLRVLRQRHPSLRVHEAGATSLPVDDGAIDAVVVADAWHWFPKEETLAEVTRALRPGGSLGCVWNDLAATTPDWQWQAMRLDAEIADRVRSMDPLERLGLTSGDAERRAFPWRWVLTPCQWRGYVATLSHVRTLPPDERHDVLAVAERLASQACAGAGTSTVALDLDAVCIRWHPAT
jgi:SAM-dependent methyltransferase